MQGLLEMSYIRFGVDSDIYIFDHVNGMVSCCGCFLNRPAGETKGFGNSFYTDTLAEMIEHVKEHIAAGHDVPDYVIPLLEEEIEMEGDQDE